MRVRYIVAAFLGTALSAQAGTVDDVRQRHVARIGIAVFAPWAMVNQKGELVGYEPDVWRRICADLGVTPEFEMPDWSGIAPAFLAGTVDFISGMTVTEKRKQVFDFTAAFLTTGTGILAPKGSPLTLETIDSPKVTLAVRNGTAADLMAQEKWPHATIKRYEEDSWAVLDVAAGRADAMLAAEPLPQISAEDYPQLAVLPYQLDAEPEAMPVRKGDAATLRWLNDWIAARDADGWLAERQAYWFHGTAWRVR